MGRPAKQNGAKANKKSETRLQASRQTQASERRGPDNISPKPKQKQASKRRAVVAARRKKIIDGLIQGKTNQEAGVAAGLSPKTAADQVSQIISNPKVKETLCQAMERLGMNNDYLAEHHKQLIEGTKVISANIIAPGSQTDLKDAGSMTKDFIEVPDLQAKARGLDMAYRLRGLYQDKINMGNETLDALREIYERRHGGES